MDDLLKLSLQPNNEKECFELVNLQSNQSHDGDCARELIADIYDERWALVIKVLIEQAWEAKK